MTAVSTRPIGIGIVGSKFMASVHCASLQRIRDVRVLAVASPTNDHAAQFAARHDVPWAFTDYTDLLALPEVDVVIVATPTWLHAPITIAAARAGKHVIVEKPLCLNLGEADAMIAACNEAGVKLMYAEEFNFAPKYVRVKQVVDEGGIGRVFRMNYIERSQGPRNPAYWDYDSSGGWVLMQLASHALEIVRWMLDKPRATSVYAQISQQGHHERGRGDTDAMITVEFEGGRVALVDVSWDKLGGADDRMELLGTGGVCLSDLYLGSASQTYSVDGYGYSGPGGGPKSGWTFTVFDELHNNGFPQEIEHFIACVRDNTPAMETGEDGRVVLEILFAAYESARTGRKVPLPFNSPARRPIDLWLPELSAPTGGQPPAQSDESARVAALGPALPGTTRAEVQS